MSLSGFERLGIDDEPGDTWIIPSALSAQELHETYSYIDRYRNDPVMQYGDDDDPVDAEDMLRRKPNTAAKQKKAEYDDDSDGDGIMDDGEEAFLFPPGGPVDDRAKKRNAMQSLKSKRRRRRHMTDADLGNESLDDEEREARRKARLEADLEKRRKIKSKEFVGDSDDDSESDADFFRREEEMRKGQAGRVMEALRAGRVDKKAEGVQGIAKKEAKRKGETLGPMREKRRKSSLARFEESGDDIMPFGGAGSSSSLAQGALSDSSGEEATDTPLSSPHPNSSQDAIGQKVEAMALDTGLGPVESPPTKGTHTITTRSDSDEDQVVKRPARRKYTAVVSDESD